MRTIVNTISIILLILVFFTDGFSGDSTVAMQRPLKPYFDHFMRIFDEECPPKNRDMPKKLTIKFAKDNAFQGKQIALCQFSINGNPNDRLILIKKTWYDQANVGYIQGVMHHELTHCVLNQYEHDEENDSYFYKAVPDHGNVELYDKQVRSKIIRYCNNKRGF